MPVHWGCMLVSGFWTDRRKRVESPLFLPSPRDFCPDRDRGSRFEDCVAHQ
ncbi:uncharacterized protein CCOS01_09815 [Colletotrichum costaricense]|uniref:Uncharacterized protein n=1 Tax=Colletotrichum costaricense TaxID=1209916 RepID=A0AAI9YSW2_9PEZI|nr:uncharacterized protein CCOS01_09815 [Colletotrichum costaricense]KAI3547648.1 hypothetical protein CSPX01_03651 [Colletotrichum filicis]KAK1522103.1 hypothetical protein CCOS01_09815 [Colletotrichum costaricense]